MMIMTFGNLSIVMCLALLYLTIDSSTRPHTKLTKFLTRNVKYMRQCTLPTIL